MRNRSLWYTALIWPVLILAVATVVQAPLIAQPVRPIKPLRTWSGMVSWYGPGFQGHKTATGETYNMFAPTAAHAWLPLGSLVRVVNERTGKDQILRINDRGPFMDDRELDVSFLAAIRLGLVDGGVARLRIELLREPSSSDRR